MNRLQFFSNLLLITAAVSSVASGFSSRPRRSYTKRGRRDSSSSPISTRRVFGFTLAGGAHKMFSTMRHPAKGTAAVKKLKRGASSSSTSTSLDYRTPDECGEENFQTDDLWQTAMYELRKEDDVDMTTHLEHRHLLLTYSTSEADIPELEIVVVEEKKPKSADSELLEAAKAFIPVAIEIGMIAAVASAQRPFIFL